MIKNKNRTKVFVILILMFTPVISMVNEIYLNDINLPEYDDLQTSDIAGFDLYSESISAYVAGDKSIIKQSLFTNDTNILSHFDINDPAFYKCNILISVSNGINSEICPSVMNNNPITSEYESTFNSFSGFLYYDTDLTASEAQNKASRALKIIQQKFCVDLIIVNSSNTHFIPFVGYYPDWEIYFEEITTNLPDDGYWKALDVDRLTDKNYYENNHLSSTYFVINSLDFLDFMEDLPTDQINFNLDGLDLSFVKGIDLGAFLGIPLGLGSIALPENSHYTLLTVQYEGLDNGVIKKGPNKYEFNLWNAMGYNGEPLRPSDKVFIALLGIFLSSIDIYILGTEIIDSTPQTLEFDDYTLSRIKTLLAFLDLGDIIDLIEDYSFETLWVSEEGIYQNHVRPVDTDLAANPVNLLKNTGYQGMPSLPSGILEPISQFRVTYNVSNSEPNIRMKRELVGGNGSFGMERDLTFKITAENVGNVTAYGVPYQGTFGETLWPNTLEGLIILATFNFTLYDQISDLVYANCSKTLEEYLEFEDNFRVFEFDSLGQGTIDYYYPNIPGPTGPAIDRMPYSQELAQLLADNNYNTSIQDLFLNTNSVRYKENWQLEPGEKISYLINVDVSSVDSYKSFFSYNVSVNSTTPEIIQGNESIDSNRYMILNTDNLSWVIQSLNISTNETSQYVIDANFQFKNNKTMDIGNDSLDTISIIANYTSNATSLLNLYVYNHSIGDYSSLTPFLSGIGNNRWIFTFYRTSGVFADICDSPNNPENSTIRIKINGTSTEFFELSINDLDINFSTREQNAIHYSQGRIIYSPKSSISQINSYSNTNTLGTDDMALIIANASLTSGGSRPGELNTYILYLKNIGSKQAENISISILIPGIINNTNDFVLYNNHLSYNLSSLAPSEVKALNFTFYTPNSGSINSSVITYNNPSLIKNINTTHLLAIPNEAYFSAPIDYENRTPFVRTIEIYYNTSSLNPSIGDLLNLTVTIKNSGPIGVSIPDLNLTMNDQYDSLKRNDTNPLVFSNILPGKSFSFNITIEKTGWKGYYYPAINFIQSSESSTIQITRSSHLVLGNISFSLTKSIDKNQVQIGEIIVVTLVVKNTGTISVQNVVINDMLSYPRTAFSLVSGNLVNDILLIEPGESITFTYTIRAKIQTYLILNEAVINYYFLVETIDYSNEIEIKVNAPVIIQLIYILIPLMIAIGILIILIWQSKRYNFSLQERKRKELVLLKSGSRDSILTIKHTLRERLNELSKENVIKKKKEADVLASIASDIMKKKIKKKKLKKSMTIKEILKKELSEEDIKKFEKYNK